MRHAPGASGGGRGGGGRGGGRSNWRQFQQQQQPPHERHGQYRQPYPPAPPGAPPSQHQYNNPQPPRSYAHPHAAPLPPPMAPGAPQPPLPTGVNLMGVNVRPGVQEEVVAFVQGLRASRSHPSAPPNALSVSNVTHAICVHFQVNELEELLGVTPMQLPILRQLHTLNQRLWTFVTCFVQGRRINTLYECFQAFLLQEGIREFHELRMGNSFLHTEAVQSLYHGPTAMLNVSTRDILNHLRQFENMIGHDAFRNSTHIDRSEFLQYLSQQYRQPNVETLGIAIDPAGFGVYIGLLRRLSNQEMKEMKNIEQEFQKGIAEKVFELTKEKFSAENRKQALDELLKTHLSTSTNQEQEQHAASSGGGDGQQWKSKRNANKSTTASLSLEMLKRVTDIDVYLDNVLRRKAANEQRNNQKQISSQDIAETDLKIRNQLTRFLMATQKSKHHSRIKVVTWVLCGIMAKIHSLLLHDDKLPDEKSAVEGENGENEDEETKSKKKATNDDDADSEDECDCCCVGKDTCKCSCTCDCHANSSDDEEEDDEEKKEEKSQSSTAKSSSKSPKSSKPVSEANPSNVAAMKQEVEQYLTTYCESNDIESLEQLLMCFISLEIHMRHAMQNVDRSALELVLDLWSDAADKNELKLKEWCQAFDRLLSVHSSGAIGGDSSNSDREEITKFIQQCYLTAFSSSRVSTAELTQQVDARVRHEFGFEKLQNIGSATMGALVDEARESVVSGAEAISPSIVKYSNALLPATEFAVYDQEITTTDTSVTSCIPGELLRLQKSEAAIAALLQCPYLVDVAANTRWQQTFAPFCGSLRYFIRTHEMILLDHASSSSSLMFLFCQNGVVLRVNEASTPSALEMLICASIEVPPLARHVAMHLTSMLVKNGGQQNFPAQLVQAHIKSLFAVVSSAASQQDEDSATLARYVLEILLAVPTEFANFVFSLLAEVAGASASVRSKFAEKVWEVCMSDMERRALGTIAKCMNSGSVTWADKLERSQDRASEAMEIDDSSNFVEPTLQLQTASSSSEIASGSKENDMEIANRFARAQETPIQLSTDSEAPEASSSVELASLSSPVAPESCRQCIDTIRKEQFGIGLEIQDEATSAVLAIQQQRLERALKRLSDELYSENTHFVLELLQNADDNNYDMGIRAKGEFVLTSSHEVIFHNNERGFSSANIQAICDVGASTKSAQDSTSSIGKKGIGFKSVFKISDSPQVHSNGFHIRFHAKNEAHGGGLGYILPFWIEDEAEWQRQQGTTFVLPLNQVSVQRVDEISESLMAFEPSILLFLRRIRELRIADQVHSQTLHFLKEESTRSRHQTVQLFSQISRKGSSDRVIVAQQQWLVVKRTLQAPAVFASSPDQVRETEIAVAMPFDASSSSSGDRPSLQQVFAYLPLRSYGFRFIVQGDFEVPSSREAIVNGSEWNQWLVSQLPGLMRQVVTCFVDELRLTKTDDEVAVAQVTHLLSLLPFENEIQAPFRSIVLDTMREISQVAFLPAAAIDTLSSLELVKPLQLLDAWEAVQDDEVLSVLTSDADLLFTTLNKKLLHFELSKALQPQQKNQLKIEKLKASHILQLLAHSAAKNDVKWTVEMVRVLGKLWKKDRHAGLLLQELRLIKCFPIHSQDAKNKKWVSLMDTGDALFLPSVSSDDKSASSTDQGINAASESFYGDLHVLDGDFATVLSTFPDARAFLIAQVKVKMIEDHDLISHHILSKMEDLSSLLASTVADETLQLKVVAAIRRYSKFLASHLLACSKCPISTEIQAKMKIWTCTRKLVSTTASSVFVMLPSTTCEMPELSIWLQDKLRQSDTGRSFDLVGCEYFEGSEVDATVNRRAAWQKLFVETLKLPMLFDVADARIVIGVKQILKWLHTEANTRTKENLSRELAGYLNKHWPTSGDAAAEGDEAMVELLRKTKWLSGTDGKFHRPEKLWMATAALKALFSESMVPYSKISWTNESLAVNILRLKKTPTLEDALSVLSSLSSRKVDNELLDISAVSRIYMLLAEQTPVSAPTIKQAFSEQSLVFTPADDGRPSGFVAVKDVVWSTTSCNGHLIPLEQVYSKSLRQFFTEVCGVERKPSINSLCDCLEQLKTQEDSAESDHEAKKHWKKEKLPILKFFAKQIKKTALSKDELRRIRKTLKTTPWLSVSSSTSSSIASDGDHKKLTWCSAKDEPVVPRTDEEREVQKIVIALQKVRGELTNRIKLVKLDQELLDELDPLFTLSKIRSLTAHAMAEPSSWCDLISESVAPLDLTQQGEEDSPSKKSRKKIQKLVKTLLIVWSKAFAQNPEVWSKADKQFQWKLQQSLLLPTLRDQHFMKPADVFVNDQTELTKESFAAEDSSGGASLQPALPIVSLFPWTYFAAADASGNQGEAAQVRDFLLTFCGVKSLKTQLSYEVIVLGSAPSESARLRSKIQQSLAVAQRLLFHQHRSVYESLPHLEIARLCREIKCVVVEDAGGLQVVYRIGKSFSVRHTPASCFLDMKTPVLYVIRLDGDDLSGLYEVLMETCRKCFGLQVAASVANLLYLASMQPNSESLEKWLVETQQLAPIDPEEAGALWFSAEDAAGNEDEAAASSGVDPTRKRSRSMLEDGEVKDDDDDDHHHQSEKRIRQSAEPWTGDRQEARGGGGGVFPPLPPSESSNSSSLHQAVAAVYPPLPASYPRGFGGHQQHQPHQPGSFQPPLPPSNTTGSQHTLHSDQVVNVGNTMSKEEREGIGRWGEEYVYKQLVESHKGNADMHVEWVNEHEESGKPYDITVSSSGKIVEYVEVKATRTMEKAVFEISMNELDQAAIHGSSYCIYRVFNAGNDALCRVIRMKNPIALVRQKKMQLALVMQDHAESLGASNAKKKVKQEDTTSMATSSSATSNGNGGNWGPLATLQAQLIAEEQVNDGDKDRKQTDLALVRMLGSEDLQSAIKAASIEQLDLALAHDALAVERKPHSLFLLLSAKATKMDQWRIRRGTPETKAQFLAAASQFLWQISQFLYQAPVSLAAKEISRVSLLCTQYCALAVDLNQSIKAIYPLKSFLRRFYQHGHTELSPLHGQFFYLCLHAKCYFAAMEILNQPLFEIHSQANLVSAVDFVSYAYYGGMLYVGQKQFQEAIDFFTLAITAPAVSLSSFVVEAFKKLVLTSLILNGETPVLPKYTPFVVTRHVESHCSAYMELSKAFQTTKDAPTCLEIAQKHAAVFVKDANFGLVKQAIEALKQKELLQLTRTYVTIALEEMATAAGWDASEVVAAEKTLLELIAKGQLAAVIDKQKAMVKFVLDEEESDGGALAGDAMLQLQREMQKLLLVSSQLRAMDAEIVTSAKFQNRLQKDKDRRQRGGASNQQQGDDRLPLGAGGMDMLE